MSVFDALRSTANTFDVLGRSIEVVQNNVANASTPGFVRQRLPLIARPFDPGLTAGGVAAGDLQSTRDAFAERGVRRQAEILGALEQKKATLQGLEQVFDVSGKTGIGASLTKLFGSFSAWSVAPNDKNAREDVLRSMQRLADDFHKNVAGITEQAVHVEQQTRSTVAEINHLVGTIREVNKARQNFRSNDPGLEAKAYSALESLSELANVSVFTEEDGTLTISLGGQFPLLVGDEQTELSVTYGHPASPAPTYPGSLAAVHVQAGDVDLTNIVTQGRLGALVEFRNETIPSLIGGPYNEGKLSKLAIALADRVNAISQQAGGPALFTYNPAKAAATIAVPAGLTSDDFVASDATANDVPLALAQLANSTSAADKVDGLNYIEFFAATMGGVGADLADATDAADVQADILAQARSIRTRISGVSLDQEAINLLEFQRAYQATAQLTTVLNSMTESLINILR